MQPNVDKSLIMEAIMRRRMGQQPQPAMNQMTQPQASLPTGAPNTPSMQPQAPQTQQNVMGSSPVSPEAATMVKAKSGMTLDDDGKHIAKALINKLMQVM